MAINWSHFEWIKRSCCLLIHTKNKLPLLIIIFAVLFANISWASAAFVYEGKSYSKQSISTFGRGQIVEYTNNDEFCHSWVHIPGTPLVAEWLLGIVYFVAIIYLCLGITVGSDKLMDSIEMMTSYTKKVTEVNENGKQTTAEVRLWKPTITNLAIMAIGSSASIILLNIIQAIEDLGSATGNLGAGTIVGSVSYNTLIITAVSIVCVSSGTFK